MRFLSSLIGFDLMNVQAFLKCWVAWAIDYSLVLFMEMSLIWFHSFFYLIHVIHFNLFSLQKFFLGCGIMCIQELDLAGMQQGTTRRIKLCWSNLRWGMTRSWASFWGLWLLPMEERDRWVCGFWEGQREGREFGGGGGHGRQWGEEREKT